MASAGGGVAIQGCGGGKGDDLTGRMKAYMESIKPLAELAKIDYRRYVNPFMHGEPAPDDMAAALAKSREYLSACHAKAVGK